ncbi:MAG: hypothetical protein ACPLZF_06550, partial [Nitrososphaeria archaeon]
PYMLEPPSPNSVRSLIPAFGHPDHMRATCPKLLLSKLHLNLFLSATYSRTKVLGFLAESFVRVC